MKKFNQLKSVLTDEFSVLNKESLMLVLEDKHTLLPLKVLAAHQEAAKAVILLQLAIAYVQ